MEAYYNEFDPYAAQWLRNLIDAGHIAKGVVDERSITEVKPEDLRGFTQCHFFAGIGGWSLAARLAGWPDERELWTGSAPCQPFSTAGNQKGQDDERHLWPKFFDLIRSCKPTTIMGEQVSAAIRFGWLDGVSSDLEGEGYTTGAVIIPACAVNAPHRRDRLWFVGYTEHDGQFTASQPRGDGEAIPHNAQGANSTCEPKRAGSFWDVSDCAMAATDSIGQSGSRKMGESISTAPCKTWETDRVNDDSTRMWINCPDGKARRIEPRIPLLVDGLPARMAGRSPLSDSKRRKGVLSGFGNAIVPQIAAEIIKAYMECKP